MPKNKLTGIEHLESLIKSLNKIGGTPKLDMLRQDYKYHDLLDVLRDFCNEYDLYPEELDKVLKDIRSNSSPIDRRKYIVENPLCNYDDYWLDITIVGAYQTMSKWIGESGETRLDQYLGNSYSKIKAGLLLLDNKDDAIQITADMSVDDAAQILMKKKEIVNADLIADKLMKPVSKSEFKEAKTLGIKEASTTWDKIPEQKRKWYFDQFQELLPLVTAIGRDFGEFLCSEEIVNYWKVRNSTLCDGEIWLKCALDYWKQQIKDVNKQNT